MQQYLAFDSFAFDVSNQCVLTLIIIAEVIDVFGQSRNVGFVFAIHKCSLGDPLWKINPTARGLEHCSVVPQIPTKLLQQFPDSAEQRSFVLKQRQKATLPAIATASYALFPSIILTITEVWSKSR